MKNYVLIALAAVICITAAVYAQQNAENKAIYATLEKRKAQVQQAQQRYSVVVKSATEARDKVVAAADKTATQSLLNMAKRMTQSGRLAEAINAYKVVCSFNPTNKEAVAALQSVGIAPRGREVDQAVAKLKPAKEVKYKFRVQVNIMAKSSNWISISKPLQAGDIVKIKVEGKYTVRGKQYTPEGTSLAGIPAYHMEGRFTTNPDNPFRIGAEGTVAAPGDGTLELRVLTPTSERAMCKGHLTVTIGALQS